MSMCNEKTTGNVAPEGDLTSLYINPTRYCNLKCRHCWISPPQKEELDGKGGELSTGEITGIIKEAKGLGLRDVKFTGGEPLLRKDITELLRFCYEEEVKTSIETNGTLIDKELASAMKRYGVSFIAVSLDSYREELNDRFRGRKGAFKKALAGIRALIDEGIRPQVIMSMYRENFTDLPEFLKMMQDLWVNNIKLNTITPLGRGASLYDTGEIPSVREILEFLERLGSIRRSFKGRLYLDVPIAFKSVEEIHAGCGVCHIKNILGILSDGSVSICGIGHLEEELLFGSVREDPSALKYIWRENTVLKKIKEEIPYKLKGVCSICVFRNKCLGYCRAEIYHNTGDLFAPYWFCQEAYDKGLFPPTRLVPEPLRAGYG